MPLALTPSSPLPPAPSSAFLEWVTNHPEEVAAYLETVHAVRQLSVSVTINAQTVKAPILCGPDNATVTLALPNVLPAAIANAGATAPSCAAQLNLLLAALRGTGQLPSS